MKKKLSDFPEIAAQFHKTKNGDSNPETINAGTHKKYWWQCEKGHEWESVCKDRTRRKSSCPYCLNKKDSPLSEEEKEIIKNSGWCFHREDYIYVPNFYEGQMADGIDSI